MEKIQINDIELLFWDRNSKNKGGMRIYWSGSIGYGVYDIIIDNDYNLLGYSECMDTNDDKDFLKQLFDKIIEKIKVVE